MVEMLVALAAEKGVELFTAGVGLGMSTYLGLRNREVKMPSYGSTFFVYKILFVI